MGDNLTLHSVQGGESTVQYSTVLYSTVQYSAVPYSTGQITVNPVTIPFPNTPSVSVQNTSAPYGRQTVISVHSASLNLQFSLKGLLKCLTEGALLARFEAAKH